MKLLLKTNSLCPICLKKIPAELIEENGKLFIKKSCDEHGNFEDLYYSNVAIYENFMKHLTAYSKESNSSCPFDCGLCNYHKSSTVLANIDVTNACNYKCPICFADTSSGSGAFNPSIEQISEMMDVLRNQKPPCGVIQLSGGEPTIRKDILDIARLAYEKGFVHIQIATNGKILGEQPDFAEKLWNAHVATIYLQFDGVTPEPYEIARGFNALPDKIKAIENLRKHGPYPNAVLVPTLVKGINDHQVGDIIRFSAENIDIVRGVNFQPVSFTGRIDKKELLKQRITVSDVLILIEEQLDGQITPKDFFPVPIFSSLFEFLKRVAEGNSYPDLNVHPVCGAWTYVFKDKNKLVPINRIVDIEAVFELLANLKTISKSEIFTKVTTHLPKLIRASAFKYSHVVIEVLKDIILKGSYKAASEFHDNEVLFIGCMHFMDAYNFDCDRIERCCIHYVTPDKKVIPFCSYNTIYRKQYYNQFSEGRI